MNYIFTYISPFSSSFFLFYFVIFYIALNYSTFFNFLIKLVYKLFERLLISLIIDTVNFGRVIISFIARLCSRWKPDDRETVNTSPNPAVSTYKLCCRCEKYIELLPSLHGLIEKYRYFGHKMSFNMCMTSCNIA